MKQFALPLIFAVASLTSAGCALKAPLVTDALPITKIKGTSLAKTPLKPLPKVTPLPSTAAVPVATAPAPGTAPAPATTPAPVTTTPASAELEDVSALTGTQTYYYSGSNKLPPLAKALQIQDMSFRSLKTDPADQTEDARKDGTQIDQCPDGRSNLDFIQSVAVGVRHSKEQDSEAVVIATYAKTQSGLCGFHLTPTNFDMKDYAADYVFVIQVTGTLPPAAISISGYYTAQDYEGL